MLTERERRRETWRHGVEDVRRLLGVALTATFACRERYSCTVVILVVDRAVNHSADRDTPHRRLRTPDSVPSFPMAERQWIRRPRSSGSRPHQRESHGADGDHTANSVPANGTHPNPFRYPFVVSVGRRSFLPDEGFDVVIELVVELFGFVLLLGGERSDRLSNGTAVETGKFEPLLDR